MQSPQEIKPNFYALKEKMSDVTLYVTDDKPESQPLTIDANTQVLAAYSKYFLVEFSDYWSERSLEKKEIEFGVEDAALFSIFIDSFYDMNIVNTILNTKKCKDKLILISYCSYFEVPIPLFDILHKIDITPECDKDFILLVESQAPMNIEKYAPLILRKINNINALDVLEDERLKNLILNSGVAWNMASGSYDGTIKIWDLEYGLIKTLTGNKIEIYCIAFSPDGKFIASGYRDGTINIWSVEKGIPFRTLIGHTRSVNAIAYSPDGRFLVSGGSDGMMKIWDISTDGFINIKADRHNVINLVYSPNGEFIASGGKESTIKIWNASNGELVKSLDEGESGSIPAYSPDGKFIASGFYTTPEIKIWDASSGDLIKILNSDEAGTENLIYSPDGKFLTSGNLYSVINIWDVLTWNLVSVLKMKDKNGGTIVYSPDGKFLVYGTESDIGTIEIWDVVNEKLIKVLEGHELGVSSLAFSPVPIKI